MNKLDKQILTLTQWWYKYVGNDHHKDRDCHWYITEVWSYGEQPYWDIHHNGYIFDSTEMDLYNKKYTSIESAKYGLIDLIRLAISQEKKWAKRVLSEPNEWDEYQVKKAHMVMEFEKEHP